MNKAVRKTLLRKAVVKLPVIGEVQFVCDFWPDVDVQYRVTKLDQENE